MILRVNEFSYDSWKQSISSWSNSFLKKHGGEPFCFSNVNPFHWPVVFVVFSKQSAVGWGEGAHHEEVGSSQYLPPLWDLWAGGNGEITRVTERGGGLSHRWWFVICTYAVYAYIYIYLQYTYIYICIRLLLFWGDDPILAQGLEVPASMVNNCWPSVFQPVSAQLRFH